MRSDGYEREREESIWEKFGAWLLSLLSVHGVLVLFDWILPERILLLWRETGKKEGEVGSKPTAMADSFLKQHERVSVATSIHSPS